MRIIFIFFFGENPMYSRSSVLQQMLKKWHLTKSWTLMSVPVKYTEWKSLAPLFGTIWYNSLSGWELFRDHPVCQQHCMCLLLVRMSSLLTKKKPTKQHNGSPYWYLLLLVTGYFFSPDPRSWLIFLHPQDCQSTYKVLYNSNTQLVSQPTSVPLM